MAYANSKVLAENHEFQIRVKYSLLKTATYVAGGASSGKAAIDEKREALAYAVLHGGHYSQFLDVLAALETTNTDEAVDTAIASVWNDMAGVTLADSA